ncbi:hypothetical protein N7481_003771 [Penicillium waksmanii]|uniref:uncharacterized protein n=1 Tax=Penicillium waksmanii TaxID=69791 RepID=UPI0025472A63|nr:uncharacterized protein N7481_003771 [Penicillium waksmanii]KAJ5988561.1 hypothetical protein N7481_003771 [Penicillium waksmanii]
MKGSRHRTAGQNYYPSIKARASNLPPASDSDESVSEASWRAGSDTAFPRLGPWYDFLVKEGYHWESHRLLSFILTLICDEYGSYPQDGSFELAFGLEKLQDAVDKFCERKPNKGKDEQILLTNFANATMLIAFLNVPSNDKVLAVQDQFRKIAKSIAGKIFTDHWELINSRIYFGWLLAESNPRSFLFDEPQFRRTPPSTSDLCRKNANEQSSADKTKKQPETRSVPDTLESKLRLIERNAAALGDLCTRYDAFVRLANMSEDDQRAVYTAKDLSLLCHEEMNDTIGYAFCLESETRMLQKSSNNIPNLTDRRQDLYLRFKKFEEMFPCHFDYTPFDKRRHYRNITFFDVPAACDEKKRGLSRLLLAMDLPVGAQFALSNMDSIGEHLPKKNPIKGHFGRYRCSGCEYCDNTNHDVYHLSRPSHYSAAPLTTGTSTNTRNRQWGEAGPYYQRPPRAPRAYSEPGNMNNSGERLPLHRQPEISSDVWDIDEMLPEKLRMKDQKSARKPETAKDTTTANERSSASPDTPRVRRASPVTSAEPSRMLDENDRAFLVPHAACESFTVISSPPL